MTQHIVYGLAISDQKELISSYDKNATQYWEVLACNQSRLFGQYQKQPSFSSGILNRISSKIGLILHK